MPTPKQPLTTLALLTLCCACGSSALPLAGGGQPSAGSEVEVRVRQISTSPRAYDYEITNRGGAPILVFVLGDGARPEMQIVPANQPEEVASPECWRGREVLQEETYYMHIVWEPEEEDCRLGPAESLAGFRLVLPPLPADPPELFHVDGTPARPLDPLTAAYSVCFSGGRCIDGRVEPPEEPVD